MNWIIKNWRLCLELILALALLIVFGLYLAAKSVGENQQMAAAAKTVLQHPQVIPLNTYTDQTGNPHLQVNAETNQVPQASLSDTGVTSHTSLDSSARAMNVKDSQITELTKEIVTLKAENIQLKAVKDTPGNTLFHYEDDHLSLLYDTKTNDADLIYHVGLLTGKITPGSWLPFKVKPALIDFSTDDRRATIGNVQHISVKLPEPMIGFTLDGKAVYDFDSWQIFPSIGANLRLGRFHLEDRAYYNQKLKQAASVSYDIVKF